MDIVNAVCRRSFALGMMLAMLILALTPLHKQGNHFENVSQVRADNTVLFEAGAARGLEVGDNVQVYRFNPGWTEPIGQIELVSLEGGAWVARYDPSKLAWPMGRQGTVVAHEGSSVQLNVGTSIGVGPGVALKLYDKRVEVGSIQVTDATASTATGLVTRFEGPEGASLVGIQASEFVIVNQIGWFYAPWLDLVDAVAVTLLLLFFGWSLVDPRPGEWWFAAGARFRGWLANTGDGTRRVGTVLFSIPAVYYGGQLAWYAGTRSVAGVTEWLLWLGLMDESWPWYPSDGAMAAVLVVGIGWLLLYTQDKGSPLIRVWNWTIYKPPTFAWFQSIPRGRINWLLHLAVFYAFAGTLTGFLVANLNGVAHLGWASSGLNFGSFQGFVNGLATMLTTAPHTAGLRESFSIVRVSLMTLCVAGCLIGYWHTLFSVLWKPNAIKNVDFTVWGWLANGFCYGPLLHGAVLVVSAHPVGLEPAVTDGGFYWLSQVVEQLMNLLYTLSILNLGTMFGVMVDKGVQKNGYYSVVRHPSYTLEPFMFLVLHLAKLNSLAAWLGHLIWPLKYYFRSERDDMFMTVSNPDYVEYKKKTKWKFIPGWY